MPGTEQPSAGRLDMSRTNRTPSDSAVTSDGLYVPTYKQAAYEALRDMIVELELPPGTRLVEVDLANRLQVSKTPIREALGLLELDGLIEFAPYRGATVRWMSVAEMEEQGYLVDTIELPVLPRLVQRLKEAKRLRAGRRYRRLTAEYHRVLYTPTGYPRLVRIVERLVSPVGLRYDR